MPYRQRIWFLKYSALRRVFRFVGFVCMLPTSLQLLVLLAASQISLFLDPKRRALLEIASRSETWSYEGVSEYNWDVVRARNTLRESLALNANRNFRLTCFALMCPEFVIAPPEEQIANDAVKSLSGQGWLLAVALYAKSVTAQRSATQRIVRRRALRFLALNGSVELRESMPDMLLLLGPLKLTCIAVIDNSYRASYRLKDLLFAKGKSICRLRRLARRHPVPMIREAALEKLSVHDKIFRFVALRDPDSYVRRIALEKTWNSNVLKKAALKDEESRNRVFAAGRIEDVGCLKTVALESSDAQVRIACASHLTDNSALSRLAVKDPEHEVRLAAIEQLTDDEVLEQIALNDKVHPVRLAAAMRISLPKRAEILVQLPQRDIRLGAVSALSDPRSIEKVAATDEDWRIRLVAASRIKEDEALMTVALNDPSPFVAVAAACMVEAYEVKKDIGKHARFSSVRSCCLWPKKHSFSEAVRAAFQLEGNCLTITQDPDRWRNEKWLRSIVDKEDRPW